MARDLTPSEAAQLEKRLFRNSFRLSKSSIDQHMSIEEIQGKVELKDIELNAANSILDTSFDASVHSLNASINHSAHNNLNNRFLFRIVDKQRLGDKKALEKQLSDYQKTIAEQAKTIAHQNTMIERLDAHRTRELQLEKTLKIKDKAIEDLTKSLELEVDQTRSFLTQNTDLQKELKSAHDEMRGLKRKVDSLKDAKEECDKMKMEQNTMKLKYEQSISDLEQQAILHSQRINTLHEMYSQELANHDSTKEKLNQTLEKQIEDLKAFDMQIQRAKFEVQVKEDRILQLERQLIEEKENNKRLESFLQEYRMVNIEKEKQIESEEASRLDIHLDKLVEKIAELKDDLQVLTTNEDLDLNERKRLLEDDLAETYERCRKQEEENRRLLQQKELALEQLDLLLT
jgi:hypothetical protein